MQTLVKQALCHYSVITTRLRERKPTMKRKSLMVRIPCVSENTLSRIPLLHFRQFSFIPEPPASAWGDIKGIVTIRGRYTEGALQQKDVGDMFLMSSHEAKLFWEKGAI